MLKKFFCFKIVHGDGEFTTLCQGHSVDFRQHFSQDIDWANVLGNQSQDRWIRIEVVDENVRVREEDLRAIGHLGGPFGGELAHLDERQAENLRSSIQGDLVAFHRGADETPEPVIKAICIGQTFRF